MRFSAIVIIKTLLFILCYFVVSIDAFNTSLIPIYRQRNGLNIEEQVAPLYATLTLSSTWHLNVSLDTSHGHTLIKCCSSKYASDFPESQRGCYKFYPCDSTACMPLDRSCLERMLYYPMYLPNPHPKYEFNTYFTQVSRQKDIAVSTFTFNHGESPRLNFSDGTLPMVYTADEFWNITDGTLGMGFSPWKVSWQQYVQSAFDGVFAVDVYPARAHSVGPDGYLILGKDAISKYAQDSFGISSSSDIVWSERQARYSAFFGNVTMSYGYQYDIGHRFTIYNLDICGTALFSNYSSSWQAEIKTNIEGVGLPRPYYRMIMNWLQSQDILSWNSSTVEMLPALSFTLSETRGLRVVSDKGTHLLDPSSSPRFFIPLKALVDFPNRKYHIYDKEEVDTFSAFGFPSATPTIDLGTRALEWIMPVMDYRTKRVGLLQKQRDSATYSSIYSNRTFCGAVPKCVGSQFYYAAMNKCVDPACPVYFLQTVDPLTKTCRFTYELYALVIAIILIVALFEMICIYVRLRVARPLGPGVSDAAKQPGNRTSLFGFVRARVSPISISDSQSNGLEIRNRVHRT